MIWTIRPRRLVIAYDTVELWPRLKGSPIVVRIMEIWDLDDPIPQVACEFCLN